MRLISIDSSITTFNKVNFNEVGPSFILAKQINPESTDKDKSYNGVGKSLLIALIDFCFGTSSKNKITKALKRQLPNEEFSLVIRARDKFYEIRRNTSESDRVIVNNEEYSLDQYTSFIQQLCFEIPSGVSFLSFRSLFNFFLRPSKQSYIKYDSPIEYKKNYQVLINNALLLGLNVHLIQKKMSLKLQLDKIKGLHKQIKLDPVLKRFFLNESDPTLVLAEMYEEIGDLESKIQVFEVAEDYYELKLKANELKKQLEDIHKDTIVNNLDNHFVEKKFVNAGIDGLSIRGHINSFNFWFNKFSISYYHSNKCLS